MAMKGINLLRGHGSFGFGSLNGQAWLLFILCALSPYSVETAAAAEVCTTNAQGKTICHEKLSPGVIAAIVITLLLVILICVGLFYVMRRTQAESTRSKAPPAQNSSWLRRALPSFGFSARSRRDVEEGYDDDDDKYLSVEKNQIHGPAWEARYDPSSAPLPGKGGSSWSSRLRYGSRSGGSGSSGSRSGGPPSTGYGGYNNQPMSAPGWSHGSRNDSSSTRKPRSAGAEQSLAQNSLHKSNSSSGKRHWGTLIHGSQGSQSKNGSKSAGSGGLEQPMKVHAPGRPRPSPALHIVAESPTGYYNPPVVPPITPHTPRTPSRLGTAPPLSAGPGFSSAPIAPRTPRTPLTARMQTPAPAPVYSPRAGHMGAI